MYALFRIQQSSFPGPADKGRATEDGIEIAYDAFNPEHQFTYPLGDIASVENLSVETRGGSVLLGLVLAFVCGIAGLMVFGAMFAFVFAIVGGLLGGTLVGRKTLTTLAVTFADGNNFVFRTSNRDLVSALHACAFERRGAKPADIRPCPHCAEDIKAAAKVCKHCGRDVEQAAA
jgi:hypothetical protein